MQRSNPYCCYPLLHHHTRSVACVSPSSPAPVTAAASCPSIRIYVAEFPCSAASLSCCVAHRCRVAQTPTLIALCSALLAENNSFRDNGGAGGGDDETARRRQILLRISVRGRQGPYQDARRSPEGHRQAHRMRRSPSSFPIPSIRRAALLTRPRQITDIGDRDDHELTPKKLAAFYKAVGGNYDGKKAAAIVSLRQPRPRARALTCDAPQLSSSLYRRTAPVHLVHMASDGLPAYPAAGER